MCTKLSLQHGKFLSDAFLLFFPGNDLTRARNRFINFSSKIEKTNLKAKKRNEFDIAGAGMEFKLMERHRKFLFCLLKYFFWSFYFERFLTKFCDATLNSVEPSE